MHVHVLTLELHLPGCSSLKEKRGRLKPLLSALHQNFNVSAAEIDHQDAISRQWSHALWSATATSTATKYCRRFRAGWSAASRIYRSWTITSRLGESSLRARNRPPQASHVIFPLKQSGPEGGR